MELGRRVGLAQSTISQIERGEGGTLALATWQRMALALGVTFDVVLGRDALEPPGDAGHLAIQELVLRWARPTGYDRSFELATKPADPSRSTDIGLRDDRQRRLVQVECWNRFGSINASLRATDRKRAEAELLAIAIGHGDAYSVHVCWVIRATRRNRALVAQYPEIFAIRFSGSSRAWIRALSTGTPPPDELGLVWSDVGTTRLFEWRPRGQR